MQKIIFLKNTNEYILIRDSNFKISYIQGRCRDLDFKVDVPIDCRFNSTYYYNLIYTILNKSRYNKVFPIVDSNGFIKLNKPDDINRFNEFFKFDPKKVTNEITTVDLDNYKIYVSYYGEVILYKGEDPKSLTRLVKYKSSFYKNHVPERFRNNSINKAGEKVYYYEFKPNKSKFIILNIFFYKLSQIIPEYFELDNIKYQYPSYNDSCIYYLYKLNPIDLNSSWDLRQETKNEIIREIFKLRLKFYNKKKLRNCKYCGKPNSMKIFNPFCYIFGNELSSEWLCEDCFVDFCKDLDLYRIIYHYYKK